MATSRKKSKTTRKRKVTKKKNLATRLRNIYENENYRNIAGLFLMLFSILMVISFVSFLFTWKQDQDILEISWYDYLFDTTVEVENATGKIGLFISQLFMYNWFGIASFLFTGLFFIIGLRLLSVKLLNVRLLTKRIIFLAILSSITLAFLFGGDYQFVGGGFGYTISRWLVSVVGRIGTVIAVILMIFGFLTIAIEGFWLKTRMVFQKIASSDNPANVFETVKETINSQFSGLKETAKTKKSTVPIKKKDKTPVTTMSDEIEKHLQKAQIIDLDTNEPLEVVEKRNYKLFDDGKERKIDEELGFEVEHGVKEKEIDIDGSANPFSDKDKSDTENTNSNVKDAQKQALVLNHKYHGQLALDVVQNQDILYESINRNQLTNYDPKLDLSHYRVPPLEILEEHQSGNVKVTKEELLQNKNKIVEALKNFKIEIKKIKATIGPTITLYEIIPAPGVRISKIKNLEDDIALSLAALGIRIIAPMPGRGTIGIEVPNMKPEIVSMRSLIRSAKFQETKMELPIALGKTISNESYVFDLTKMPHILVAGATGQGKSVGLNAMLASLLYKKHPSELKFVLVDPKKVELTLYERLEKHFLAALPDATEPIITDNQEVLRTVSSLNVEMDDRYNLLKKAKARNIKEYNAKFTARKLNPNHGHKYLPYIVLIIDEFADLIMTAGKEIELPIARLAQLARAVGIHLIVATQRPSTNIITGVIKANFPARIAFKVASMIDSRTILDSPGANQLIGRGDMLISQGSDLVRLQCAFIDTPELEKLTEYIEGQQGYAMPFLLPEPASEEVEVAGAVDLKKRDELFEDAARIIVMNQQGSTSLIQRKLAIGYNRAGRIMDQIEAAGIVGPSKGSKPRDVYIMDEYSLEQIFDSLP